MKLVFVSNFYNLHQEPLCQAFFNRLGTDFTFIETTPMDANRVEMGFYSVQYPYVKKMLDDPAVQKKCLEIICQSDVAIMGSVPESFLKARLKTGKLTFKYSERFFKGGNTLPERVKFRITSFRHIRPLKKENLYFLCASAYTAQDINRYENFIGRSLKWGYFREVLPVSAQKLILHKKANSILWVGRMIDWKHPEYAVELAKRLKLEHIPFSLQMVGDGDKIEWIRRIVEENDLKDCVQLLGAKTPDTVRSLMDQSEIYIGTSDFKEGWGVVINEAMNSCCAVVASHAMGSAPFLIENGVNGILFESGNVDSLFRNVTDLLKNKEKRQKIQSNAHRILQTTWNAEVAAERFSIVATELLEQRPITQYQNGPCSEAEILKNNWFQE